MNNNNTLMKTIKQFTLGCMVLAMASCASPEERSAAANNAATDSAAITAPVNTAVDSPSVDSIPVTATATPDEVTTPVVTAATPPPAAKPAPAAKKEPMVGEALIKGSDCLACHNATKKLVGPAYVNVAAKYPATEENIDHLASKIIEGGSGVWGAIPMSPHPAISKDDAKEMVKYILSLKK